MLVNDAMEQIKYLEERLKAANEISALKTELIEAIENNARTVVSSEIITPIAQAEAVQASRRRNIRRRFFFRVRTEN